MKAFRKAKLKDEQSEQESSKKQKWESTTKEDIVKMQEELEKERERLEQEREELRMVSDIIT